jgi:predicted metal-dependent hydrolase
MMAWFGEHSREILESRVAKHMPDFLKRDAPTPRVRYRRMAKRWGSCSPKGAVTLNTELGKAPLHCIDYVVVHELCHLLHPHHDQRFHRLLSGILPDWKHRKDRLEQVPI